ncbi:MAG: hypothetical protein ACTSYR_01685 [Candidatus Odinarchaeia archaeon]
MPVEYQCSICKDFKTAYESYFCLLCQEIICHSCAKTEALKYRCFRCGVSYEKNEARENYTECVKCLNCPFCNANLRITYERGHYFFKCPHCGWSSENQDPMIISQDMIKLTTLSRKTLHGKRLYEEYRIYCPKCRGTLIDTVEGNINSLANVMPHIVFKMSSFPVETKVQIPYQVRNPRPEGAFFRIDWEQKRDLYDISELSRSAEFDFHSPFIKIPRSNSVTIKSFKIGKFYISADLTYKFDEIRYGNGKIKFRIGPIFIYPKIEFIRLVEKPINVGGENKVTLIVRNSSDQSLKQLILSDMIMEGAIEFKRKFWEVKNIEPGQELEFKYSFKDAGKGKIKFDSLRGKIRFTKFMPNLYFDYVSPIELVEV